MNSKVRYYIIVVLLLLLLIVSAGAAAGLHGNTLIVWWMPLAVCVMSGFIIGLFIVRYCGSVLRLVRLSYMVLNYIVVSVWISVLLLGAFYSLNYFGADVQTEHIERTVVERKYSEEHYRTRRVSRRTTVRGERYKEYYLTLRFEEGQSKDIRVPPEQYAKRRNGDTVIYKMRRGLLGFPVITDRREPVRHTSYRL